MPPPLADSHLAQMSLLPASSPSSSSSCTPDSPSPLVVQQSSIMPDRSAFDDDTVHTHPLMTRARSKTQPELSFTPHRHQHYASPHYHATAAQHQPSIHPTDPPAVLLTPSQQQSSAHHNKSKSHHTPATLLRARHNNTAHAVTHKQPSQPQQPQGVGGERVLEPREKKQRMLEYAQYAQSRRQQAAKRAKEKAERAMQAAKGIRDSLQANSQHNSGVQHEKRKPAKPLTAKRKQEAAGGLFSIGTQTATSQASTGRDMKDIEQRLVAMIRQARVRLQHETNDLEEDILADKENKDGKGGTAGTQPHSRREGQADGEAEESEEEKTARLTYLHSHLLVCEKLERQVLDCLDSTFALLEAYGADEEATTATDRDTANRAEGGTKKRKKRVGKRMSKFERLLMEEKEKDILRMRRLQQQHQPDGDHGGCLPLPPSGDGSFDLYHSASSLSASTGSSLSASSQSFTFHDRASFHTLQVNDRQSSQQPATAFLQSADEHQVVIPSPSPKLQSPNVAAVSLPPAFSLVTHDPSSSIVTFPSPSSSTAAGSGTTPPHPRRLSWQQKQQLWTGHSPKQPHILNYATIQLDTNTLSATARRMMSPILAHQRQPSILAPPFNYSMTATPRHHTQRSNVSTDLRVIHRQPSLQSPPSAGRDDDSKRTASVTVRLDDPASIAQLLANRVPPMSPPSISSPHSRSHTHSPPQPSAPPLEPVPECDSAALYRAHLLPAFIQQQHDLLYEQIRLCYEELTACRSQLGGSLSAQQRIERQWDEVCLILAHRGTRVCKYHSAVDASGRRWGRERAERWLQLDASGLSMQWSRRKAVGPYSSLLLSTITDIHVGHDCDFIDKLRSKDNTRRLIGRATGMAVAGGGSRSDVESDVDVACCVSFVGLKRRLDVVFEERMEVDVWLWTCQRAKAATGVD